MQKLSVVIITFNEELNIGKCIDSVAPVADEVIVLDSFSTDKTKDIAEAKGAKFFQHIFDGHIQQKNRVITYAQHPFVLSIDADEQLSPELQQAILQAKQNKAADGYTMNRLNFYCGKPIKTCGWYPDKKLRLWDAAKGKWGGVNPHDKFEMQNGAVVAHLNGDLLHDTYPTHEAFLSQVDKFAAISAKHLQHRSYVYLILKLLFSPWFKFVRNYFIKLGFTDGLVGLTICYHQSREVWLKYWRAIKLKAGKQ